MQMLELELKLNKVQLNQPLQQVTDTNLNHRLKATAIEASVTTTKLSKCYLLSGTRFPLKDPPKILLSKFSQTFRLRFKAAVGVCRCPCSKDIESKHVPLIRMFISFGLIYLSFAASNCSWALCSESSSDGATLDSLRPKKQNIPGWRIIMIEVHLKLTSTHKSQRKSRPIDHTKPTNHLSHLSFFDFKFKFRNYFKRIDQSRPLFHLATLIISKRIYKQKIWTSS